MATLSRAHYRVLLAWERRKLAVSERWLQFKEWMTNVG